jgi:hypothetical protein
VQRGDVVSYGGVVGDLHLAVVSEVGTDGHTICQVQSKWGDGAVYAHDPLAVPDGYNGYGGWTVFHPSTLARPCTKSDLSLCNPPTPLHGPFPWPIYKISHVRWVYLTNHYHPIFASFNGVNGPRNPSYLTRCNLATDHCTIDDTISPSDPLERTAINIDNTKELFDCRGYVFGGKTKHAIPDDAPFGNPVDQIEAIFKDYGYVRAAVLDSLGYQHQHSRRLPPGTPNRADLAQRDAEVSVTFAL